MVSVMERFNPSNQAKMACHSDKYLAHTTKSAPTLAKFRKETCEITVMKWLEIQLLDLAKFVGVKDKLNEYQTTTLANMILSEFYYYKLTEIMVFLFQLKGGKFGKFYGSIDPVFIMQALREYDQTRLINLREIEKIRQDKARREQEEQDKYRVMSREEYEELKWLYNMGYELKK